MSQMMPNGYGYPQQQQWGYAPQVTQADANVQNAAQRVRPVLEAMRNSGRMTVYEYNTIFNMLSNYQALQNLMNEIRNTFGYQQIGIQDIDGWLYRRIERAVNEMRLSGQMAYQQQAYQQPMQMGMPMQNTGVPLMQPQSRQQIDFSEIYGSGQQQQHNQVMSTQPVQHQQNGYRQEQQPVQGQSKQPAPVYDNKPFDVGNFMDVPLTTYKRTEIPTPTTCWVESPEYDFLFSQVSVDETESQSVFNAVASVNEVFTTMEAPAKRCESLTGSLHDFLLKEEHITDEDEEVSVMDTVLNETAVEPSKFVLSKEQYQAVDRTSSFAVLMEYSKPEIIDVPFRIGKEVVENITTKLNSREPNRVSETLGLIRSAGENFERVVGNLVIQSFNNAARVSFVDVFTGSVITKFNQFQDLQQIYQNTGEHEEWKRDPKLFKRALQDSFKASLGRLFIRNKKLILDPTKDKDLIKLLACEMFRSKLNIEYGTPLSDVKNNPNLMSTFGFLVTKKVMFHNMQLPEKIVNLAPGKLAVLSDPIAQLLMRYQNISGPFELVNIHSQTDMKHPLIVGVSYNNALLIRRSA